MGQANAKYSWRSIPIFILGAFLPACSGTPVGAGDEDANGTLTETEALALARGLGLESLGFGQSRMSGATSAPARVRVPSVGQTVTITYALTRPCLLGGTVHSSGSIRVQTDSIHDLAVVDISATDTHNACVFLIQTTRVAVTGDPAVTATIHAASMAGEPLGTQSVGVKGGVRWVADDGRSGRCSLDILVEADEAASYQATRGTICGFTFDVTVQG